MAIVLLDKRYRLIHANRRARELDEAGDGVSLSSAGITLKHHEDRKRLEKLIAQAVSQADVVGGWGGAMTVRRCFGKRDYQLQVIPLVGEPQVLSSSRPAVCITIRDPHEQSKLSEQQLQEVFGMTRAEALLAVSLAQGNRLKVTAEQLGITYGTARTRLSDIFQKTQTSRQGELIALILTTLLNL
jgi:DNA-binding CsgD family transcriptional regulator